MRGAQRQFHGSRGRCGAAMVETALVTVALLALTAGIMDFGRLVWCSSLLAHAAREGTRFAIVRGSSSRQPATPESVRRMVFERSPGLPSNAGIEVTFTPNQSPGSVASVAVSLDFYPIPPFAPMGPIRLTSQSRMVIVQ